MLSFKEIKVSSQHLCSRTGVTNQAILPGTEHGEMVRVLAGAETVLTRAANEGPHEGS